MNAARSACIRPVGHVFTGTHSHGQGHETTFSQLVSDTPRHSDRERRVSHGDTNKIPFGMGTYGSRSLAVGGSAIIKAMDKIIAKSKRIAAHLMEASVADVEFKNGVFTVVGTDKSVPFGHRGADRLCAAQLSDHRAGARPGRDGVL
jgi:carbon-monoxide dehydrogenase large subunit